MPHLFVVDGFPFQKYQSAQLTRITFHSSFLLRPWGASQFGCRRSTQSRMRVRADLSGGTSSASSKRPRGNIQRPKMERKLSNRRRSGASRSRVASTQMRVASTIEQPRLALAVGGRLVDQPAGHVAVRPNALLCCEQIPASLKPTDLSRTQLPRNRARAARTHQAYL